MQSLRFEVVMMGSNKGEKSVYTVASLHGPYKAVAMATSAHESKSKPHRIHKVEVNEIPGDSPLGSDLVDRLEW